MPKFFYSDCVISDLRRIAPGRDVFMASIDGRQSERLTMEPEVYQYLTGIGKGTKNRVWFFAPGFKKVLMITGMENAAGERQVMKEKLSHKLYNLTIRPACAGFLFWFLAWVVLVIPVALYAYKKATLSYKGPGEFIYNVINPIGIYGGIALALGLSFAAWHFYKKLANLDAWQSGETTSYTKAVKPAFGSGLAASKK
ncbi:hypothetical protein [Pseudomonas sp. BF-R-19]|uniref:hypothetical protein n=1 Tax=Pseudomonas sp. BF-R-19 TaxID=2832397 RepID=UPI001CBD02F7|nr:hypothetical protein [Pseudomonas sp. BF-R-19]